ncbi:MAG: response regulator [Planctomycetales bacterium]|nr:response regulator [Planctomycetales bacterium]
MVRAIRNFSINTKLLLLAVVGVVVALAISSGALLSQNIKQIRRAKVEELSALADVLGSNVNAAIEFEDPVTATNLLSSLKQLPSVESAIVYDLKGRVFATYPADWKGALHEHGDDATESTGYLEIERPIKSYESDGESLEQIGSLVIRSNQGEIDQRVYDHIWLTAKILLVALAVSFYLSMVFQRSLSRPIAELVETARHVTGSQKFDRRAEKFGDDEHGKLCDAFNTMLDRIESDQRSLQKARDELEIRVQQRTAELREAVEEARNANEAKSNFLANMSHEIRTPMTAVLGFADLLAESELDRETLREFLAAIRRNGEHLLAIINDILDVTKIEVGKIEIESISCSPHDLIQELIALFHPRASEKQIDLSMTYRNAVPLTIKTDPTRLRQILGNLIANAIKFTEVGEVRVTVEFDETRGKLICEVADSGCGIPHENFEKIFQPFTQSDETMTRKFGGTGLGLTISKQLAALLGGDIEFDSKVGVGTKFIVSIDAGDVENVPRYQDISNNTTSQSRSKEPEIDTPLAGLRVLLVEDGFDNQRFISFVLTRGGASVEVADNGAVGMECAMLAWKEGRPFDVVLMDLQMPVMDGYTTTRVLREQEYPFPIVALTAHAMSHEHNRCIEIGCDAYATKPIIVDKLFETILSVCESVTS